MSPDADQAAATARHAALDRLRRERRRISDAEVGDVLARIERGGLADVVEPWLTAERGRPATLTGTALLAGMFLTAEQHDGAVLLTNVTDTLYFEISPRMRQQLRVPIVPDTDRGF